MMYMKPREVATKFKMSHWAGIIRECKESGLSIRAFCENAGFHASLRQISRFSFVKAILADIPHLIFDNVKSHKLRNCRTYAVVFGLVTF